MSYTLTFNQIYDSDISKVGFRAVDLAAIYKSKLSVPLSFVVPDIIFEEFMLQNRLSIEISKVLNRTNFEESSSLNSAYLEIKSLFRKAKMPEEFLESLEDAYMALGAESSNAESLLKSKAPIVNLIVSPGYELNYQDLEGVLLNIRGFDNFVDALKSSWHFLFSPKQLQFRRRKNIRDFSTGIIVQRYHDVDATVEILSKSFIGNFDINLEAYRGLPDVLRESSKDSYSLTREYLSIEQHESSLQEYKIVSGDESGLLVKRNLGKYGSDRKIDDKQVVECARLVKRASSVFDNHFKAFMTSIKGEVFFFLVNRLFGESSDSSLSSDLEKSSTNSGSSFSGVVSEDNLPDYEQIHSSSSSSDSNTALRADSDNSQSRHPDKTFFLDIILDLEPQLDSEILRMYKESFGFFPKDVVHAIEELSNKHGFPEKEQIYKLKNMKVIVESGKEVDLDDFIRLTDNLKKFLER